MQGHRGCAQSLPLRAAENGLAFCSRCSYWCQRAHCAERRVRRRLVALEGSIPSRGRGPLGPARTRAGWRRWRSGQSASQGPGPHPCRKRKPGSAPLATWGPGDVKAWGEPSLSCAGLQGWAWPVQYMEGCPWQGPSSPPSGPSVVPSPQHLLPSPLPPPTRPQTSRPQMEPMSSGRRCLQRGRPSVLSFLCTKGTFSLWL